MIGIIRYVIRATSFKEALSRFYPTKIGMTSPTAEKV